jgi:tRNA-binding EMAP/Myf-like protein
MVLTRLRKLLGLTKTRERSPMWVFELPMELIIEIMAHLDRVGLESLIALLNIPLPGVFQYVMESYFERRPGKGGLIKQLSLDDLEQNYSKINIVDIVGLESMNSTKISKVCKALSNSINHINLCQIEESLFKNALEGKSERIFELINSLPNSSKVVVKDCKIVKLYDNDTDLRKTEFSNINCLHVDRCGIKGGTKLSLHRINCLRLIECSNELLESIDLEAGNLVTLNLDSLERPIKLKDKTINAKHFPCYGGLNFHRIKFTGRSITLRARFWEVSIRELDAPNLTHLGISFVERIPSLIGLKAPILQNVTYEFHGSRTVVYNNKYTEDDFKYLQQTIELKLNLFYEPLYRVDLPNLRILSLFLCENIPNVGRVFPFLEKLTIVLGFNANCVPHIEADSLQSLKIDCSSLFNLESFIPTINRYPEMKDLSFTNCECCVLTRERIRTMVTLSPFTGLKLRCFRSNRYRHHSTR